MKVQTKNYTAVSCDKPSEYTGSYGVMLFENDKLMQHQTWARKPTEQDLLDLCKLYQDYYDKENKNEH